MTDNTVPQDIPVKIDGAVLAEIEAEANKATHQDLPRKYAITWVWGEYKRLKRLVERYERAARSSEPLAA